MQSYSAPPMEQVETYIETTGDSEFLKAVDGRKADKVWKLMDELVEAVKILHPRMYTTFIDKVQDLQKTGRWELSHRPFLFYSLIFFRKSDNIYAAKASKPLRSNSKVLASIRLPLS